MMKRLLIAGFALGIAVYMTLPVQAFGRRRGEDNSCCNTGTACAGGSLT